MGNGARSDTWRRRPTAAAVVLLAVAASCTSPLGGGTSTGGTWARLPDAPVAGRADALGAWTGTELVVWGGASGLGMDELRADGAAYDPARRRWRVLAPSPLSPRLSAASVWTGRELLVWGGYDHVGGDGFSVASDGAAYDPATDRWRPMARSPLSPRAGAIGVWSGREAIFLGGQPPAPGNPGGSADTDSAAYDPAADSWHPLPRPPVPPDQALSRPVAIWTGQQVQVWWPWTGTQTTGSSTGPAAGIDRFAYDPVADRWVVPPPAAGAPAGVFAAFWTGTEIVVPAAERWSPDAGPPQTGLTGARSGPDAASWRPIAHGPVDDSLGAMAWTGSGLVRVDEVGRAAAWDEATDRWRTLSDAPFAPEFGTVSVWTGHQLLLWGNLYPKSGPRVPQWSALSLTL